MPTRSPKFTLQQLFLATSVVATGLGLCRITGSYVTGIHLAAVGTGWVMCRFGRGHLGGIIPTIIGVDFLALITVDWLYFGNPGDWLGFREVAGFLAMVLLLIGVFAFIFVGARQQRYWQHQIAFGGVTLVLLFVWGFTVPRLGDAKVARIRLADLTANNLAATQAIALVEDVCCKLARIPTEEEFTDMLTDPMPTIRYFGQTYPIRYRRVRDGGYELSFSSYGWDEFVFLSREPEKGWQLIPF